MNQSLLQSMQQILSQKGLPKRILVEAIEEALLQAARRRFGADASVSVQFNDSTGEIRMSAPKRVVEIMRTFASEIPVDEAQKIDPDARVGQVIQVPVKTQDFGRIEAQLARQMLVQKIKDAERANVYALYKDRIEEIVSGVVQQEHYRDVIVEINGAEAVLPAAERLRNERYERGNRIRSLVIDVVDPEDMERQGRRPKASVTLSRAHPVLLIRLFEQEVPEIADGLVHIEAVARDPGERSKIAASSHESGIDPLGTCVGVRGSRVQMVMQELNGERIDVIEWSPDPRRFIANALSPVKNVTEVSLEQDENGESVAIVVVPDDQLSLAIGRRGQNARLASDLTGWHIDIVGEREAGAEARSQAIELFQSDDEQADEAEEGAGAAAEPPSEMTVEELPGMAPKIAQALQEHGYGTIAQLAEADPEELSDLLKLGAKTTGKLVDTARLALNAEAVRLSIQEDEASE